MKSWPRAFQSQDLAETLQTLPQAEALLTLGANKVGDKREQQTWQTCRRRGCSFGSHIWLPSDERVKAARRAIGPARPFDPLGAIWQSIIFGPLISSLSLSLWLPLASALHIN